MPRRSGVPKGTLHLPKGTLHVPKGTLHLPAAIRQRIAASLFVPALLLLITAVVAHAEITDAVGLELVVSVGAKPVAIRNAGDGSGRLFIVRQQGDILVLDSGGALLAAPFLDIGTLVDDSGTEQGLLGLAFHPHYKSNGYFYINYTRNREPVARDRTVIARYTVSSADPNLADSSSGLTLLEIEQDFSNHNGGDLLFGPDGYLYIAVGDGGSSGDPNNRAQTLDSLLGKLLRIDVDSEASADTDQLCGLNPQGYGIPAANPFVGDPNRCPEVWAFGLRNPWRLGFDANTGDLFIGDVGQATVEEIDFQPVGVGGRNYGWRCREGDRAFNSNPACPGSLVEPILTYTHADGCSVTGGYRYRGGYGPLAGTYIYADFCSGRIWFAREDTEGIWANQGILDSGLNVSSFGEDETGEIYLTDLGGAIYRLKTPKTGFIVPVLDLLLD